MQTIASFQTSVRIANDAYASSSEAIIIEGNVLGFTHFNVSVTNYGAGSITDVSIYASADGFNYYTVQAAAIASIASGATAGYTFTCVNRYLRITATSASTSHISCCLLGDL